MLQVGSNINVADNSGAREVRLIGIPGRGRKRNAVVGNIVAVVVKEADPYGHVKKGEVVYAVVVRTRKEKRRRDGSYIRFDDNACVVLEGKGVKDPKGTRFFGPIAKEIKDAGFVKIASSASEVY